MNILLLYATYSGGTEVAANAVADVLKAKNHSVTMKNPTEASDADIMSADLTVLCTPTWDFSGVEGMPHEDFNAFTEKYKSAKFPGKKFVALGLGDSSYTKFCGSIDVLEQFLKSAGGELAQPSLRIDGFFFDQAKHTESIKKWTESLG